MTNPYKDFVGYLLLTAYLAVPVILWSLSSDLSTLTDTSSIMRAIGQVCGLLGASLFSLNFVLAARLRWVENLLTGLPRVYSAHHNIGGIALILLLGHPLFLSFQFLPGSLPAAVDFFVPSTNDIPKLLGMIAMAILIGLLFITFFIRIAYHKWKATHQWLGLSLLIASLHVYLIPGNLSSAKGLRYYMLIIICLGLLAFLYRVIFGRWLVPIHHYKVKKIKVHNNNGTEVSLAPTSKPVKYRAGQFFFIRVHNAKGITREPHPFSFTSPPAKENVSFTAKPLGDYTSTLKLLAPGTSADIEGPYGCFIFERGGDHQVWIAGGIGIAPFMSRVRELSNIKSQKITLYYVVRNKNDALFIAELELLAKKIEGFTLRLWESGSEGRFTTAKLLSETQEPIQHTYFICGPAQMISSVKQDLRKNGVKRSAICAEEFNLY